MGSDDRGADDQVVSAGRRADRFGALTWLTDDPAPGLVPLDDAVTDADLDFAPTEGLVGSFEPTSGDIDHEAGALAFEPAGDESAGELAGEPADEITDEPAGETAHEPAVAALDGAGVIAVPNDARELTGDLAGDTRPAPDLFAPGSVGGDPGETPVTGHDADAREPVALGGVAGTAVAASGDEWRSPRPLPAAVPPTRRRWPKVLAAALVLVAIGGTVAALAARDRTDDAGSSTAAAGSSAGTNASAADGSAGTTAAAPATTGATTTAATTATSTAPAAGATSAPAATTTAATTGAAAATATLAPAAADDAVDLFTPVRWAIFDNGKVQLLGRVPSQAAADTIATKAAAVVGKDNVQVSYTIDPAAPLPPSAPLYVKDLVLFDESSAALHQESYGLLDLGVALMQQNPAVRIRVVGRADNRGDANKNLLLSLDRAQAVIDYVAAKGIDRTRLTPVPLGSEAAVGDNDTAEGQAQNRSVAFVITGLLA